MSTQNYNLILTVNWVRPVSKQGHPYKWGDAISAKKDLSWEKRNLIYRWLRNSDGSIAYVGKTENLLKTRVGNYKCADPTQGTNMRVNNEQQLLAAKGDYLYLEFTDAVAGYNLKVKRELLFAEKLLIALSKPYLQ